MRRNSSRDSRVASMPTSGSTFDAKAASMAFQSSALSAASAIGSTTSSSVRMCAQWKSTYAVAAASNAANAAAPSRR